MTKLSRKTLEAIASIVTGDNDIAPYRTWNDLEAFWDDMEIDINNCNLTNATSRSKYVLEILSHYNRIDNKIFDILSTIISEVFNYQNFLDKSNKNKSREDITNHLNNYLLQSNLQIVSKKNCNSHTEIYYLQNIKQNIIVSPNIEKLNHAFIEDQHKKIIEKIQTNDFDGAIANARTLVEAVMQEILKKYGKTEEELDNDLDELYKVIKKEMKLSVNSDLQQTFKQILSGLQSLVSGFSALGNKMSERHATKYRPSKHHAELAINSAYTISEFLLSSYEHQNKK